MWKRSNTMSMFILKRKIDASEKNFYFYSKFLSTLTSLFFLYDYINNKREIYTVEKVLKSFSKHLYLFCEILFTNIIYIIYIFKLLTLVIITFLFHLSIIVISIIW